MAHDGEDKEWEWAPVHESAARATWRRWAPWLLAVLVVAGLVLAVAVQTSRVDRLNSALGAAHVTATAQAHALSAARRAAVATATAAARANRRPAIPLKLPPAVARPACTAVARAQRIIRTVLQGVKGADKVVDAASRALQHACAASSG